jgi:hypothetical protein
MQQGILIGSDIAAEWLIPWWWKRYREFNGRPVSIVDFGMSLKMRSWCLKKMEVIPFSLSPIDVRPKNEISKEHLKLWKKQYRGPLWQAREAWFKKPGACLLSPYDLTLWIDLDCEVCESLDPVFAEARDDVELVIGKQDWRLDAPVVYNSGVILFRKKSPFLHEWNLRCFSQNASMMGDQDVLTSMLLEGNIQYKELSPFYNWLMYSGVQPGIVIAHWSAGWGKEYIRRFGGLSSAHKTLNHSRLDG